MKPHEIKIIHGKAFEFWPEYKCPCCDGGIMVSMNGASSKENPVTVYCPDNCTDEMFDGCEGEDIETGIANMKKAMLHRMALDEIAEQQAAHEAWFPNRFSTNYEW